MISSDFVKRAWQIFEQSIADYHKADRVDQPIQNPFPPEQIDHLLYLKNWVDTVQWHYEDLIRDPYINPEEGMILKRKIDASNQHRTDLVENLDAFFYQTYREVTTKVEATINTESPAWAIDRLSILALKIYHMREEAQRGDATQGHRAACAQKLEVLLSQHQDLSGAIEQLLADFAEGLKFIRVYKQMKMYNDDTLNPVLRDAKRV